jgi:ureidoglycolate lyase
MRGPGASEIAVEALSAQGFAPFGQVIEAAGAAAHWPVNEGTAERFHDLARIDTAAQGGRPLLSIFRAQPRTLPMRLVSVERHRLGSQAFVPMMTMRFLVVVAAAGPPPRPEALRCFIAQPGQGVNYAPGTWHHALIALDGGGDFMVIDRGAGVDDATEPDSDEPDCDEHTLEGPELWLPSQSVIASARPGAASPQGQG